MIKYMTVLDKPKITLKLMGRTKTFTNNTEVTEDIYTKAYPQYFKRIGEVVGVIGHLNTPSFIPDPIEDFLRRETIRSSEKEPKKIITLPQEVMIDELAEASKEFNDSFDVKIETEEDL